jgi:hypothetical protein
MVEKGKSPFYPGQPVPEEFFTGREEEINRIIRALGQVALGKPQDIYLSGEYGIGKSSLASFMRYFAEKKFGLLGLHVLLGSATDTDELTARTIEVALKTEAYTPTVSDKIKELLGKYIKDVEIFGININMDSVRNDASQIARNFLPFLNSIYDKTKETGLKGIFLILDEINGIASNPQFAHFIKGLVDENALSRTPLPLMLMLCGVEERRKQMIHNHEPIERIFDIVDVNPMNEKEVKDFFEKTLSSVGIKMGQGVEDIFYRYSAGFPKMMHEIGDAIYWMDKTGIVTKDDAIAGILAAANNVGKKYVDQQVIKALKSEDYKTILKKLCQEQFDLSFIKGDIENKLSETEKKKFHNFLTKMKKLKVLKSGEVQGEYVFNNRLVRIYIMLDSVKK